MWRAMIGTTQPFGSQACWASARGACRTDRVQDIVVLCCDAMCLDGGLALSGPRGHSMVHILLGSYDVPGHVSHMQKRGAKGEG